MSNRQERRARKQRQREGLDAYVHIRPTERHLRLIPFFEGDPRGATKTERMPRQGRRALKRRTRLYGDPIDQTQREDQHA